MLAKPKTQSISFPDRPGRLRQAGAGTFCVEDYGQEKYYLLLVYGLPIQIREHYNI